MSTQSSSTPPASSGASALFAVGILVGLHLILVGGGFGLRSGSCTWQKGPLVDRRLRAERPHALPHRVSCPRRVPRRAGPPGWQRRWWLPVVALVGGCAARGPARLERPGHDDLVPPHPTLHWAVRADLDNYEHGTGNTPVTTNGDGFRGGPDGRDKPDDEYRIVVLGDSSNFGQGVSGTEMWEHQLQEILQPHFAASGAGTVRVINAACPGWTTYQGVELMREVAGQYDPDLVIAGFNNDPGPG